MASACGSHQVAVPPEIIGYWSAEAHVLEIRSGSVMVLTAQKMFAYEGRRYPVLSLPIPGGERQVVELKKCDPRSCYFDIQTLETFYWDGDWRSIQLALTSQELNYQLVDSTHLRIKSVEATAPGDLISNLVGSVEFQISSDMLTLTFPDQRVLTYRRGCEARWCTPTATP